ncbi:MAG: outer membrane lipoprotein chaperone LolA [Tatlockia sp.]|nr:outer membrane lipoprotein chaperone LolA [Tatlockia sp.]
MKKLLLCLLSLVFCSAASSSTAGEELQARLNAMRTMTAEFKQVVKSKKRDISNSSGTMALERPGRFRWQTKEPMAQLVVADGRKLWVYDVDLEQVTVKKQDDSMGGTAGLFLSGNTDNVTRDFEVKVSGSGTDQSYDLLSKSEKANFQRLKLIFSKNILTGIEMFDQLGQHTVVNLTKVKTNPKVPAKLFQFQPPKGMDVVQQ